MGKILIMAGSILCLSGVAALIMTVIFLGKQRVRLIEQINNEYRGAE